MNHLAFWCNGDYATNEGKNVGVLLKNEGVYEADFLKNVGVYRMTFLKNERVYEVNHLKNERVCVEIFRFYSRSIDAPYDVNLGDRMLNGGSI